MISRMNPSTRIRLASDLLNPRDRRRRATPYSARWLRSCDRNGQHCFRSRAMEVRMRMLLLKGGDFDFLVPVGKSCGLLYLDESLPIECTLSGEDTSSQERGGGICAKCTCVILLSIRIFPESEKRAKYVPPHRNPAGELKGDISRTIM